MVLNPRSTFLRYLSFKHERKSLLQNFWIINSNLISINEDALPHLLIYEDDILKDRTNTFLLLNIM